MFLQFFTWGAWFATMGAAFSNPDLLLGAFEGGAYGTAPIAAIFAPLFLGLVADRFFPSQRIFGTLMLVGGVLMLMIPSYGEQAAQTSKEIHETLTASGAFKTDKEFQEAFAAEQLAKNQAGNTMSWLILAYMLCYMPTLGLGNTIAFTHVSNQSKFPMIRVWGTIGWIVAGLLIGGLAWDRTLMIFKLGGISSLVLGVYCFTLPNTPPPLKGKPFDLRSLFMVDAFKLMKDWNFLVFAICSTLVCIPLAFYYGLTSKFLPQTGFQAPGATMTLGQMSEIFFMILIPFFFRRLGVKAMILIGIGCWIARYLLFAFGAPQQITWMLLGGIILHGVCYDFFFVTGFMYTDQKAPKEIRGQSQALLVFLTQGIGMYIGYLIAFKGKLFNSLSMDLRFGKYGEPRASEDALNAAIKALQPETELSFFQLFGKMFTRSLPENLDSALLLKTMTEWQNYWMLPAILATIVFVLFFLLFWDRTTTETE